MDVKQAFAELGLTPLASPAEAKAAYRALAMRWHPDIHGDLAADSRMKSINVAYALICQHLDAQARVASRAAPSGNSGAECHASTGATGFTPFDWKTGFKTSAGAATGWRGELVQRTLQVSLFEAAFGCVKRVSGLEPACCARCGGSGEFPGTWTLGAQCMQCGGRGLVAKSGGVRPCNACQGSGRYKPAPPACSACKGTGKTERQAWLLDVQIHAGTLDGHVVKASDITVRNGAPAARDFKLTLQLEKHPLFKLVQDRLSVAVPISFWRWSLGGEITVPTLEGIARVTLPLKPAALLVKHQGWPEAGAPERRKPLFVLPRIVYPEHLSDNERELLQMLDARDKLSEVEGWKRHVQAWAEACAPDAG